MACDRAVVIELLLTWSEVEACRDPCRFHCHRRQQKPWRAQLLLDFPPTTGKLDEWRATIRSLVAMANKDYQSPLMKAYVDEVRKLEEHFDGIQAEHVPRAENDIADYLSKCAALKLPVEPGTFVLR